MAELAPVTLGPTWQRGPDGLYSLPRWTLAWEAIEWCWEYLKQPDGPSADEPWRFTDEQARFLAWWYAVDEHGRFIYRRGVLRRMKGWGKDPLGAVLCAIEFVGPCRVGGWSGGEPVAVPHPAAWVQTAAVAKDQTRNTMTLFPGLFTKEAIAEYHIDLGKEIIYAERGRKRLEAVTSSPRALEGGRSSFTLMNETHHWVLSNEGHEMARVIRRNLGKSRDGQARALAITNAHQPGEDSVGERDWDGYLAIQEGQARSESFLYDSVEAPHGTVMADRVSLRNGLLAARGDSDWLDVERIIEEIYDPTTPPSESRRFYLNQIVAAEDAWVEPRAVHATARPDERIAEGDSVFMFGDGSKSDDATGLVLCRLSDGFIQVHHVQQPKRGEIVNRDAVDAAVIDANERYKVRAFWFDPSHAMDDDATGDARFWWPLVDKWHERYGRKFSLHAVKTGDRKHSVAFDMLKPAAQQLFQPACEQLAHDIEEGIATHDGSSYLVAHMMNARRRPGRYGVGIGKEHRMSKRKVDLAVCAVGARMLWRQWRLANKIGTPGKGRVVVMS